MTLLKVVRVAVRRRVEPPAPVDAVFPEALAVFERPGGSETAARAAYRRWLEAGRAWRDQHGYRELSVAAATPDLPFTEPDLDGVARHVVAPEGIVSTGWPAVAALCAELDIQFDDWQAELGKLALGKGRDGLYSADLTALSVSRQTGKTHLLGGIAFALCLAHPGTTVIWTSHRSRTAGETYRAMAGFAALKRVAPHIERVVHARGDEAVRFTNGSRILFGARERGFGRGFADVGVLIFDEAQILSEAALDDMLPATNAAANPLVMLAGTPPKPADPGEVFTMLRAEALAGEGADVAYVEIAAEPDARLDDRKQWPTANPSYPHRTTARAILRMRKALSEDSFRREALGIWPTVTVHQPLVKPSAWAALVDVGPDANTKPDALAVDMSHGREIAVAGCWLEDPSAHVEIVWAGSDPALAIEWVAGRAERRIPVIIDSLSPASAMAPELRARRVRLKLSTAADMARACGMTLDRITAGTLTHDGHVGLAEAVQGARKRPIRDAGGFAWDRRDPTVAIYPLVAVSLALLGATENPRRAGRTGRAVFA